MHFFDGGSSQELNMQFARIYVDQQRTMMFLKVVGNLTTLGLFIWAF